MLIIPPESLDSEVLKNVLESWINQEGTDYGEHEISLEEKLENLRSLVQRAEVLIVFDEGSESLSLMNKLDYQQALLANSPES